MIECKVRVQIID